MEYGIVEVWNGMEKFFHTFLHFQYLLILRLFTYKVQSIKSPLIRNKIMKKNSSQRSIQMNGLGKKNRK